MRKGMAVIFGKQGTENAGTKVTVLAESVKSKIDLPPVGTYKPKNSVVSTCMRKRLS